MWPVVTAVLFGLLAAAIAGMAAFFVTVDRLAEKANKKGCAAKPNAPPCVAHSAKMQLEALWKDPSGKLGTKTMVWGSALVAGAIVFFIAYMLVKRSGMRNPAWGDVFAQAM